MAEETTPQATVAESGNPTGEKPAAKKAKEPALEDKPFQEFIEQYFTPSLKSALDKEGLTDVELAFKKQAIPIVGSDPGQSCWQVIGSWQGGKRQFQLYFLNEAINGQKAFSYTT
ncbi:MAG: DUF2996 domain-containing protein, partial [Microcystaceae cyanobacterium]